MTVFISIAILFIINYFVTFSNLSKKLHEAASAERTELTSTIQFLRHEKKVLEQIMENMAVVMRSSQATIDAQNILIGRLNSELTFKETVINKIMQENTSEVKEPFN